jgi:hypothetical protein
MDDGAITQCGEASARGGDAFPHCRYLYVRLDHHRTLLRDRAQWCVIFPRPALATD